jgi:hypothetical protein
MMDDSPELAAAMRLIDVLKSQGFCFTRIAPGEDGPLHAVRETAQWHDKVFIAGFSDGCHAVRMRRSALIVPGDEAAVAARVEGDALTVLRTVAEEWVTDRA